MKKFVLIQNGKEEPVGKYATKVEAADVMEQIIDDNNDNLDSDDENYLTAFDFRLEEVEVEEINEIVLSFDDARAYLNGKPNNDFTVSKKVLSGNCVHLADVARLVQDVNPNHIKALVALNELFTIAEAWNKADNFVPDFSDANQYKYYPWFVYDKGSAGFVSATTNSTATFASATFGSRLCFKTRNRAIQFGKQFVGLYNQVFLLNK
ncbi:hypothetical protein [Bacteroides pyogenes]|uniref:hypothetical protein n=1 Tax=Bacteroides pyogenes TaxID=310300 RepID=UPI001BAA17F0|nr:hypothetical protein [Bacteroides pyogenes]MBR8725498.1 hypothetical protein [Bacteroides pyogenes]MBR8737721.1 hypothetical protein [Bacteroides pyogenes]MBR8753233.1 hypothetical protein [Bacteroides pyogenes]MBR8794655.1 hypothetical protein [Bacteroides pyogenes]